MKEEKTKKQPYITVTSGMSGFFAVFLVWCEESQFYEPFNTGIGRYKTRKEAEEEAKAWAECEEVECRV